MKLSVVITRPIAWLALVLALSLLLALVGSVSEYGEVSAGGSTKVTVNSTANTDDGDCEGSPNDGTGNCTLREAINEVNAGNADIITFHPPVFSSSFPGVIDICFGGGELPFIEVDVVIDATNTGVVLDGGTKDMGCTSPANWGIYVNALVNGLDFSLIGGDPYLIRNFDGDGITIDCNGLVIGSVSITNVTFEQLSGTDFVKLDCPIPTSTPTPCLPGGCPVGGISLDSDLRSLPFETNTSGISPWGVAVGIVVAACVLAVGGAALWSRQQRPG